MSNVERLGYALIDVLLKLDETFALYDIGCCCCKDNQELLAAFEANGLDYDAMVTIALHEKKRREAKNGDQ